MLLLRKALQEVAQFIAIIAVDNLPLPWKMIDFGKGYMFAYTILAMF